MASMRGYLPRLYWGPTTFGSQVAGNALHFAAPLDQARSYPVPRDGSEWATAPSGAADAWITGSDQCLTGDLRWIPPEDGVTPQGLWATGWDGPTGVAAWLSFARGMQEFRYLPDSRNALLSPELNTDGGAGIARDWFSMLTAGIAVTRSIDLVDGAQRINVTAGGTTGWAGIQQVLPGPWRQGVAYTFSAECAAWALVGGATMELLIHGCQANGSITDNTGVVGLTNTTYTRQAKVWVPSVTVPYARFHCAMRIATTSQAGSAWFRNAMVEQAGAASATYIPSPSYRVLLKEPLRGGEDRLEMSDLSRALPITLRTADDVPFGGY